METTKFTFHMQDSPFESGAAVTKELIKEALDHVFSEAILGNYTFFVLATEDEYHYIQAIFEDGQWYVELSLPDKRRFSKKSIDDSEVYALFYDFFDSKAIETSSFQRLLD